MTSYLLYIVVSALAVASPGPGVVMTLGNGLRFGWRGAIGGIFGIAFGAILVAAISATSLGLLLATSARAFAVAKLVGAAYLLYLGLRLWRSPHFHFTAQSAGNARFVPLFRDGVALQLTNPKPIVFFLSVFPQFIVPGEPYAPQFVGLVLTYCALILTIHSAYALLSEHARIWFAAPRSGRLLNRAAASAFVFFSTMLATAKP